MSEVELQQVLPVEVKPIKKRKLSLKEQGFVKDLVKTGNRTEAAARNYNVKNRLVAANIGNGNVKKPHIQDALQSMLQKAGYNPTSSIEAILDVQHDEKAKVTGADKLNAAKFMLELAGVYKKHNTSVNYNFDVISQDQAYQFTESYGQVIGKRKKKGQTPRNQKDGEG